MNTPLDSADGWWLEQVMCNTTEDTVSFTLYEKKLIGKKLLHTSDSHRAMVYFSGVVTYLVADETNLPGNEYDERDDGYLHVYSRSRFLDFMNHSVGQSIFESFPKATKHYGLATADHIVYVMASEEPKVEVLG
jgi:hypothetical protein